MLIVSDTSPLTALLSARREALLRAVFDRVVIPPAVERELLDVHALLPPWIEVIAPQIIPPSVSDAGLDVGETEAIALAMELQPDALLMDERLGRRLASRHGLRITGLLGFLVIAKHQALISEVAPIIREMQSAGNCWFAQRLLQDVCASVGETWES